jgi:hypothetical protein
VRRSPHRVENPFERRNARIEHVCTVRRARCVEPGAIKFDLPSCDVFRGRLAAEIETAMTSEAGDALAKEQNLATLGKIRDGRVGAAVLITVVR